MSAAILSEYECAAPRWRASLALDFESVEARTKLARRAHDGPLVVQKPFHPEGPAVCQVVIVHPPGGIAGGDALEVDVEIGPKAHAQLTQPALSKWYRSEGVAASQSVHVRVAEHATLEWLPQGAIVFDGARVRSTIRIAMAASSRVIAWELVCLGRRARGERFVGGSFRQCIEIVRADALIWSERVDLDGGNPLLDSPVGLNGAAVFGTLVAASPTLDDGALTAARAIVPAAGECTLTRLPDVLVARYRGPASDQGLRYFAALWSALRPRLVGRAAVAPRIWST